MKNAKFIFFDVGYTLVNEDKVWQKRCEEQAELCAKDGQNITSEAIFSEIFESSRSYLPQYRTVQKKLNFKMTAPYRHELEEIYPCVPSLLSDLSKNYKLGIIANQTDGLIERLKAYGISDMFSVVISSWDEGIMKPDPRLFEIAVERSGFFANECVMVGDRLDNDIKPAKMLGMKTVRVLQGFGKVQKPLDESFIPDVTVSGIFDLEKIF